MPDLSLNFTTTDVGKLKEGRYVLIDDNVCKISSISTSKPGKHGSAKASIEAIDIFTGSKRSLNAPVTATAKVPMIDKRKAQILKITGDEIQLMDSETFETFEMTINADHTEVLEEEAEIMYIVAWGQMKIQ